MHWSRDGTRIAPETLVFELWPDLTEFPATERNAAPGCIHPGGRQAYLYSADNVGVARRHFGWMREYGIDGAWLQHFAVDLKDGPNERRYESRLRVVNHVREAAQETGRVWALAYDIAGMPADRTFGVLTRDWKAMVDAGDTRGPRHLHERSQPAVQIGGFYYQDPHNHLTPDLANRLIDFFKDEGPYSAFLVGGGDRTWARNPDPAWRAFHARFDPYMPWNVGHTSTDRAKVVHASTGYWGENLRTTYEHCVICLQVVYPGFGWDNLVRKPPGTTTISRREGAFSGSSCTK